MAARLVRPRHPLIVLSVLAILLLAGCVSTASRPSIDAAAPGSPPEPDGKDRPDKPGMREEKAKSPFSQTSVFPGPYRSPGENSYVVAKGPYAIGEPVVETIKSAIDGEPLQVAYVRPVGVDRAPVILHASTYLPPMRSDNVAANRNNTNAAFLIDNLVPHGYAVAFTAVRGSGGSGGCQDVLSEDERADLAQVVGWLSNRSWSNGAVGMIGLSYDANNAWQVAATGHTALKTVVVGASWPDVYDTFVRNGTPSTLGSWGMPFGFPAISQTGTFYTIFGQKPPNNRLPPTPTSLLCPHLVDAMADGLVTAATGQPGPLGSWERRNVKQLVEQNYRGTVLATAGFGDDFIPVHSSLPWVGSLEEQGIIVKQVLGQWGHNHPDDAKTSGERPNEDLPTRRADWAEILLRWFDHWLKEDTERDIGVKVQVADQTGRWRDEQDWPPRDAKTQELHLGPGTLGEAPRTATWVRVAVDPARAVFPIDELCGLGQDHSKAQCPTWQDQFDDCPGCVFFEGEVAEEEWRFAGEVQLPLKVRPTGAGGRITVHLYVAGEEAVLVSSAQMDLRYSHGGRDPRTVLPGQELVARMQLEPADAVVPVGSRLILVLTQGGYGHPMSSYYPSGATAPIDVALGPDHSRLRLGVFHRGQDAFFEAPTAFIG